MIKPYIARWSANQARNRVTFHVFGHIKTDKFRYPSKQDVQVLKGINLGVDNEDKRVVALCGTSGCGKSSIISLIERFYDPEEGEVLFNGRNIKELDPRWLHN